MIIVTFQEMNDKIKVGNPFIKRFKNETELEKFEISHNKQRKSHLIWLKHIKKEIK
jgi:hypothetical protein